MSKNSVKYHVNPETLRPNVCRAIKKKCKYGDTDHFQTREEALKSVEKSQEDETIVAVRKKNQVLNQLNTSFTFNPKKIPNDFYMDMTISDDQNDYHAEPAITEFDRERIARDIFQGVTDENIKSAIETLDKAGMFDADNWQIDVDYDDINYDDGENYTYLPTLNDRSKMVEKIMNEYTELQKRVDTDKVLNYVASKGGSVAGLTPVAALRKQLQKENNNKSHRVVDNATVVTKENVPLSKIEARAKNHLAKIKPRMPVGADDSEPIGGVVSCRDGRYFLIDGYHRYKYMKQNGAESAVYFVME